MFGKHRKTPAQAHAVRSSWADLCIIFSSILYTVNFPYNAKYLQSVMLLVYDSIVINIITKINTLHNDKARYINIATSRII